MSKDLWPKLRVMRSDMLAKPTKGRYGFAMHPPLMCGVCVVTPLCDKAKHRLFVFPTIWFLVSKLVEHAVWHK